MVLLCGSRVASGNGDSFVFLLSYAGRSRRRDATPLKAVAVGPTRD